jgi:hypothetical protein
MGISASQSKVFIWLQAPLAQLPCDLHPFGNPLSVAQLVHPIDLCFVLEFENLKMR